MVQRVGTLADWRPSSQATTHSHHGSSSRDREALSWPLQALHARGAQTCMAARPMLIKTNSGCLSVKVPFEEDWNEGTREGTG